MGRPIKSKYFGTAKGVGTGGEGLASVALGTAGSGYSQGLSATVSAPQLPGGTNATVSVTVTPATGAIAAYVVTLAGSGYTSAPTVTLVAPDDAVTNATFTTGSADIVVDDATGIYVGMQAASTNITSSQLVEAVVGTTVTLSAVPDGDGTDEEVTFSDVGASGVPGTRALTTSVSNIIRANAFLTGGSASVADIDEQVASKKYRVQTADGTGVVKLVSTVTSSLSAGEMNIHATDGNGSTYWVKKLTARRAVVTQSTASGSFVFSDGASVGWNLSAANSTDVLIDNH